MSTTPQASETEVNPYPSTATKAVLLDMMFEECGRAGYKFDRDAGEDVSALRRLDGLMAEWQARGIRLNYNFPAAFGQGKPTDSAGIPDAALNAVALWGAMRIAPGMGKTLSPETRKAMAEGYSWLAAETATIPDMAFPENTARGMGHKPWSIWRPFEPSNTPSSDPVTLADLVLADATAPLGSVYATVLSGYPDGCQLALTDDASAKFTLSGNLLRGVNLTAGTYHPVVSQIDPRAANSPYATTLTIVAS